MVFYGRHLGATLGSISVVTLGDALSIPVRMNDTCYINEDVLVTIFINYQLHGC